MADKEITTYEEMKVEKLSVAECQLKTAIHLFFDQADPVSIHTLACAAYNIIRDVNKARGGTPMIVKEKYVQESGKISIKELNDFENFFKHADRDPDSTLVFYPKMTEIFIGDACQKYSELTGKKYPEFDIFGVWMHGGMPEGDIPEGWEAFVQDIAYAYDRGDRRGYYDRWIAHLSKVAIESLAE